jgi:hypothetical protein
VQKRGMSYKVFSFGFLDFFSREFGFLPKDLTLGLKPKKPKLIKNLCNNNIKFQPREKPVKHYRKNMVRQIGTTTNRK